MTKVDATAQAVRRILSRNGKQHLDQPSLFPAGVMVLLYPKDGYPHLILNKRTDKVEHHKGEISFPGGAQDPQDTSFLDTALRETEEEMGIRRSDVEVLGELDDVPTRSGFLIHPFVGLIPYPCEFRPSDDEVAEVLEVPLSHLFESENARKEAHIAGGELNSSSAYVYQEHLIYGATAKIIEQFLRLLAEGPETEAWWKDSLKTNTQR
jgi:8-oxo-dGTP pyrophosphatase MutT (NUDIX family)